MDTLLEARLSFRVLLEKYGLVSLAGSETDAIAWIETQIIDLADSVARRERFRELLRQTREILTREQDARHPDEDPPGSGRKEKPHPFSARRFRQIRI